MNILELTEKLFYQTGQVGYYLLNKDLQLPITLDKTPYNKRSILKENYYLKDKMRKTENENIKPNISHLKIINKDREL